MEEIEVGEYIRTKQGYIFKVKSVYKDMIWWCDLAWILEKDITKHSNNIIDLIEEGDYVNGSKVVGKDNNCILILTDGGQTCYRNIFENKDIKSIVTKEQFNSIAYRLEE